MSTHPDHSNMVAPRPLLSLAVELEAAGNAQALADEPAPSAPPPRPAAAAMAAAPDRAVTCAAAETDPAAAPRPPGPLARAVSEARARMDAAPPLMSAPRSGPVRHGATGRPAPRAAFGSADSPPQSAVETSGAFGWTLAAGALAAAGIVALAPPERRDLALGLVLCAVLGFGAFAARTHLTGRGASVRAAPPRPPQSALPPENALRPSAPAPDAVRLPDAAVPANPRRPEAGPVPSMDELRASLAALRRAIHHEPEEQFEARR